MLDVRSETSEGGDDDEGGAATPPAGEERHRALVDRLFLASIVVAVAPIVVAVVRAARRGWLPIGDNAYFAIRANDVLTEHHPLLGTWTSASQNTGTNFNNPGPLLFDALAVPTKLIGGGIGVAVGAAIINSLAVIGIAVVAHRRGGPVLGTAAMATTALLCWSMGSELLFDPWQPHSLLLPFLLGLLLVWSLVCGDAAALPWAVGVGSLIVQSHLSYAVLSTVLAAWGCLGLALSLRRGRTDDPPSWPAKRRRVVLNVGAALVVGALCWAQPVIEQFAGEGQGNLGRLAGNMTQSERSVGVELGTRIVADILVPPFWFRPSFGEALRPSVVVPPGADELTTVDPSFGVAVALVLAAAAGLAAVLWMARRRGDRVVSAALSTALVAWVAGLVTSWNLPFGVFGVPVHQFRWLWPLAAFTSFALVAFLVRWSTAPHSVLARRAVLVLTAATVIVSAGNLPTNNQRTGPSHDDWAIPVMAELAKQMAVLEGQGPLLLDFEGVRFAEPYTGPVMAELQRRGIPFMVEDEGLVRQFGPGRRVVGTPRRLQVADGERASIIPPGARRVALVEGLTAGEATEHRELAGLIGGHLRQLGGAPLTRAGALALQRPERVGAREAIDAGDVATPLGSHAVAFLVDHDLLELDDEWQPRYERFAALTTRLERGTVALYLKPFDPAR